MPSAASKYYQPHLPFFWINMLSNAVSELKQNIMFFFISALGSTAMQYQGKINGVPGLAVLQIPANSKYIFLKCILVFQFPKLHFLLNILHIHYQRNPRMSRLLMNSLEVAKSETQIGRGPLHILFTFVCFLNTAFQFQL